MARPEHDVIVVGAGLAGLAAAWHLRDQDVLVLEASDRAGGRIMSEPREDCWLNFGAHVFSGPDSSSGRLIDALGLAATPVPGNLAAVALNGAIVTDGPVETYPFRLPLGWRERVAFARAGLRLRLAVRRYAKVARPRTGESPAVRQQRMLDFREEESFAQFIGPLPADVAEILRSTLTRSSGEPEELAAGYGIGYFHLVWNRSEGLSRNILGGSAMLTERLAAEAGERLVLNAEVVRVSQDRGGVSVTYGTASDERQTVNARAAVVATPAPITRRIVDALPSATADALAAVAYGPYVVGAFLTQVSGPMPWDSIYALATPKRSFSMLFNTANVLMASGSAPRSHGSLMVYAAAGRARELADLDDAAVTERFHADVRSLYPELGEAIVETRIKRWQLGLPHPRVGRARLQPALTTPLGRIHLAGDYLGSWYTETAAHTAEVAAEAARVNARRPQPARVE